MNAFKVKIFEANGTKSLSVGKTSFCVGRGKQCDVVLDHDSIQEEHVRVWCEGGRLWIQDLGTASGTTLNDMKLPPLKPMLCREIDTLQLGHCSITLSIEPIFVRQPQVKPAEAPKPAARVPEVETPEALKARRAELAATARELAEVRLQLQMARMEKESVDEIKKYREKLQEQVKALEVHKSQLVQEKSEWEVDKVTFRKNLDIELADLRFKTQKELKQTIEAETKKFESWRKECVDEMSQMTVLLMGRKARPLVGKTISAAQVKELEQDVVKILRRVLLNETAAEEVVVKELYNYNPADAKRVRDFWKQVSLGLMGAVAVVSLSVFGWIFVAKKSAQWRSVASEHPPVKEAMLERARKEIEAKKFKPETTTEFKKSYTDNVLFTTGYVQQELSQEFRKKWILELNKVAVSDWKLSENVIVPLVSREYGLVQELSKIRLGLTVDREKEGIEKMRTREKEFQAEIKGLLKTKEMVEKFNRLKRSFFVKNQKLSIASTQEQK